MKKFLSVAFIFFVLILIGCGSNAKNNSVDKNTDKDPEIDSVLLKDSLWVADSENMPYLNDAITRKDAEYLKQLMIEGKVFIVDKDTKVMRFGVAADKNNVLILFKEGRYTNKTGCTHASNVIEEKKFPVYMKEQKQKKIVLIQESLLSTENYSEVISTGNLEEIEKLSHNCLDKTNELKRFRLDPTDDILEQAEMAIGIIFARDKALMDYKHLVEYADKTLKENPSSKNFRVYDNMQKNFRSDIDKDIAKAEQLRQDFRAKYGY